MKTRIVLILILFSTAIAVFYFLTMWLLVTMIRIVALHAKITFDPTFAGVVSLLISTLVVYWLICRFGKEATIKMSRRFHSVDQQVADFRIEPGHQISSFSSNEQIAVGTARLVVLSLQMCTLFVGLAYIGFSLVYRFGSVQFAGLSTCLSTMFIPWIYWRSVMYSAACPGCRRAMTFSMFARLIGGKKCVCGWSFTKRGEYNDNR